MKAMLASALGATRKVNGTKVPSVIIQRNGFLDKLKMIWAQNAKVLIVCGDPSNFKKNDNLCNDLRESFGMSGLSVASVDVCDNRIMELASQGFDIQNDGDNFMVSFPEEKSNVSRKSFL